MVVAPETKTQGCPIAMKGAHMLSPETFCPACYNEYSEREHNLLADCFGREFAIKKRAKGWRDVRKAVKKHYGKKSFIPDVQFVTLKNKLHAPRLGILVENDLLATLANDRDSDNIRLLVQHDGAQTVESWVSPHVGPAIPELLIRVIDESFMKKVENRGKQYDENSTDSLHLDSEFAPPSGMENIRGNSEVASQGPTLEDRIESGIMARSTRALPVEIEPSPSTPATQVDEETVSREHIRAIRQEMPAQESSGITLIIPESFIQQDTAEEVLVWGPRSDGRGTQSVVTMRK